MSLISKEEKKTYEHGGSKNQSKMFLSIKTKILTTGKVCHGVERDSDTPTGISSVTIPPLKESSWNPGCTRH